jgi:predicted SAM-dependent methyltransferase
MKRLIGSVLEGVWGTSAGQALLSAAITATQYRVFSERTVRAMRFDLLRLRARARRAATAAAAPDRLHLGCGARRVAGWLNVDVAGSDQDLDLVMPLPWRDSAFSAVVSQHVVEHLDLRTELLPLMKEVRRVTRQGGEIWLSCPDLETVCHAYATDRGATLLADRSERSSVDTGLGGVPTQHYLNYLFVQDGEHRNLLDLELFQWLLARSGFGQVRRVREQDLLDRFPEFPPRRDDAQTIYVRAIAE